MGGGGVFGGEADVGVCCLLFAVLGSLFAVRGSWGGTGRKKGGRKKGRMGGGRGGIERNRVCSRQQAAWTGKRQRATAVQDGSWKW